MDRPGHTPRNPNLLISGLSGYILLAGFVNIYAPDTLWQIGLFIIVLTVSTALLLQYVFRKTQQSLLLSVALAVFLVLRFFGLRSPLYPALLLTCIISLELTLRKR